MSSNVKIAVVGAGGIAVTSIIPAIRAAGFKLVGFQSRNPTHTHQLAEEKRVNLQSIVGTASVQDLVSMARPDVLIIAGPSGTHTNDAMLGIHGMCDVLIEKPVAITRPDIARLLKQADSQGTLRQSLKIGGIFQKIYTPEFEFLERALKEGRFGNNPEFTAFVPWYRSPSYYGIVGEKANSWKGTKRLDGGGAGMNQGIHYVDMIIRLMAASAKLDHQNPILKIRARTGNLLHSEIEVEDTMLFEAIGVSGAGTAKFFSTTAEH